MKGVQNGILSFFIFIFIFLHPFSVSAETKEFTATGIYARESSETHGVAKERAARRAMESIIAEARPWVIKVIRSQNMELSIDQVRALISLAANYEVLSTKEMSENGRVKYDVTLRAVVSAESVTKWSSRIRGKSVAEDYKALSQDLQKNQKEVDSLKKRLSDTLSEREREVIQSAIRGKDRLFQSLIFFGNGLDQFMKSEYDEAIQSFDRAININGNYILGYSFRGAAYDKMGRDGEAVKDYLKIIEIDPDNAIAYHNLGSLSVRRGEYDNAVKNLTRAIQLNPGFDGSYNNRGFAYHQKGQYDKAIKDFSKAISIDPRSHEPYYNRGYAYYKKGQYRTAIDNFSKAIELYPDYREAQTALGLASIALGNREQGVREIEKACAMNYEEACKLLKRKTPDEIEYDKAWLYLNNRENEKALDIVKQINKPDDIRSVVLFGLIYLRMNRSQDALNVVGKALPEAEKIFSRVKSRNGFREGAKEAALKKFYYYLFFIRGFAHFQLDDCSAATRDFLIYLEDDKDNTDVNEKIGICFYKEKKYNDSLRYFKHLYEILEEGPQKDSAAYNLASLHSLLGNVDEAIYWLKIPLRHTYRSQVLDRIENDKDFDAMRNIKKFEEFIKNQKQK